MQGLGSWNQFLKIANYLKTSAINFSGTESASLSTLNSVRAQNPVSAEADGECPQREPICCRHRKLGVHSGWTQPFWAFSSCSQEKWIISLFSWKTKWRGEEGRDFYAVKHLFVPLSFPALKTYQVLSVYFSWVAKCIDLTDHVPK